jgi:hypothetical protein
MFNKCRRGFRRTSLICDVWRLGFPKAVGAIIVEKATMFCRKGAADPRQLAQDRGREGPIEGFDASTCGPLLVARHFVGDRGLVTASNLARLRV